MNWISSTVCTSVIQIPSGRTSILLTVSRQWGFVHETLSEGDRFCVFFINNSVSKDKSLLFLLCSSSRCLSSSISRLSFCKSSGGSLSLESIVEHGPPFSCSTITDKNSEPRRKSTFRSLESSSHFLHRTRALFATQLGFFPLSSRRNWRRTHPENMLTKSSPYKGKPDSSATSKGSAWNRPCKKEKAGR